MNEQEPEETRLRHAVYVSGMSNTVAASAIAQGLRIIGYGFMAIAVSVVIVGALLVTYWNAQ